MTTAFLKVGARKYPIDRSLTLIGRDPSCDVQIEDQRVSGRHAFIIRDGDSYELFDFKSSNGIKVDGIAGYVHGKRRRVACDTLEAAAKEWDPDPEQSLWPAASWSGSSPRPRCFWIGPHAVDRC